MFEYRLFRSLRSVAAETDRTRGGGGRYPASGCRRTLVVRADSRSEGSFERAQALLVGDDLPAPDFRQ
ncbi:hypothetical protein A6A27_26325 [Micromonospora sp. CB01531]|nr:hypothetical protein A6A27_26325 [Micromonospora sp. CB01531]